MVKNIFKVIDENTVESYKENGKDKLEMRLVPGVLLLPRRHKNNNYNTPQSRINTSSDYGQTPNIFRLPHIDYNNDQKLNSIQEQIEQRELQKLQTQNSKKRKEGSKHSERNGRLVTTTSLPAISKSGDDYLMIQQHQKGNKIEKSDYYIQNEHSSNKDQHKIKD
ncbi:hypothetical protein Avbf_05453 [Armadillidium vulgare]|nr:hypothetical protein Avbf_05453 [Armadillidium vulgare]